MKSSSSQGQRQVSLEEEVVARCAPPDGASPQGRAERRLQITTSKQPGRRR